MILWVGWSQQGNFSVPYSVDSGHSRGCIQERAWLGAGVTKNDLPIWLLSQPCDWSGWELAAPSPQQASLTFYVKAYSSKRNCQFSESVGLKLAKCHLCCVLFIKSSHRPAQIQRKRERNSVFYWEEHHECTVREGSLNICIKGKSTAIIDYDNCFKGNTME